MIFEDDYRKLVATAVDTAGMAAVEVFRRKLAAQEEELVPADVVDRIGRKPHSRMAGASRLLRKDAL